MPLAFGQSACALHHGPITHLADKVPKTMFDAKTVRRTCFRSHPRGGPAWISGERPDCSLSGREAVQSTPSLRALCQRPPATPQPHLPDRRRKRNADHATRGEAEQPTKWQPANHRGATSSRRPNCFAARRPQRTACRRDHSVLGNTSMLQCFPARIPPGPAALRSS